MKLKPFITLAIACFTSMAAMPQSAGKPIKALNPGAKVPDYILTNLINFPEETVKLTDFKGKILILDFWTFGCTSCIASWPKLMKLQDKYKDQIQIMLVNVTQDKKAIQDYLDKRKKISGFKLSLPIACGDKVLKQLFPHVYVPHVIFIDREGVVKNITEGVYLHEANIDRLLKGIPLNLKRKTDEYMAVSWSKPLYVDGNGGTQAKGGKILFSTMIKAYGDTIPGYRHFKTSKDISYGVLINATVFNMFRQLYGGDTNRDGTETWVPNSRVSLSVADTSHLVPKINGILKPENHYGIQVTAQKELSKEKIKSRMIRDLEDYFGLKTYWTKVIKPCMVISRNANPIPTYKEGKNIIQLTSMMLNLNNVSIKELINRLTDIPPFNSSIYPIVDETGYKEMLGSINYSGKMETIEDLAKALRPYGMEVLLQDRAVDVLVVEDAK